MTQPYPGLIGAPEPPPESKILITIHTHNEDSIIWDDNTAFDNDDDDIYPGSDDLQCSDTFTHALEQMGQSADNLSAGMRWNFRCPKQCLQTSRDSKVIGTTQYGLDSSICESAIHNGVINRIDGG
jgi:hypothetical protein